MKIAAAALLLSVAIAASACSSWQPIALDGVVAAIYPLQPPRQEGDLPRPSAPVAYVVIVTTPRGPQQCLFSSAQLAAIATLKEGDRVQLIGRANAKGTRARWESMRRGSFATQPQPDATTTTL